MKDRIKFLRKHFNLTQEEFAARLSIKRGAVANYEIGRNIPSDSVIALICKVFNVNKEWLLHGEDAKPFVESSRTSLDDLAEVHFLPSDQRVLIEKFIALKPAVRQGILDYFLEVAAVVNAGKTL